MKGMVFVEPGGLRGAALRRWVDAAAQYTRSLPPRPPVPSVRKRR